MDTARPLHHIFDNVLTIMSKDPNIDMLVTYAMHEPMCVEPINLYQALKRKTDKPMLFSTSGLPEDLAPILRDLESMDIPAYISPDRTAVAAWALVEDAKAAYRKQRQADWTDTSLNIEKLKGAIDEGQAKKLLAKLCISTPANAI